MADGRHFCSFSTNGSEKSRESEQRGFWLEVTLLEGEEEEKLGGGEKKWVRCGHNSRCKDSNIPEVVLASAQSAMEEERRHNYGGSNIST